MWIIIILLIVMVLIALSMYLYRWYLVGQYKESYGNEPDEKVNEGTVFSVFSDISNLSKKIDEKKTEEENK